jgi:hypothetical protein
MNLRARNHAFSDRKAWWKPSNETTIDTENVKTSLSELWYETIHGTLHMPAIVTIRTTVEEEYA